MTRDQLEIEQALWARDAERRRIEERRLATRERERRLREHQERLELVQTLREQRDTLVPQLDRAMWPSAVVCRRGLFGRRIHALLLREGLKGNRPAIAYLGTDGKLYSMPRRGWLVILNLETTGLDHLQSISRGLQALIDS